MFGKDTQEKSTMEMTALAQAYFDHSQIENRCNNASICCYFSKSTFSVVFVNANKNKAVAP
jgi:hypothetical protein